MNGKEEQFSDNGYSSMDGTESYLDYDNRSDNSTNYPENRPEISTDRAKVLEQPGMAKIFHVAGGTGHHQPILIVGGGGGGRSTRVNSLGFKRYNNAARNSDSLSSRPDGPQCGLGCTNDDIDSSHTFCLDNKPPPNVAKRLYVNNRTKTGVSSINQPDESITTGHD